MRGQRQALAEFAPAAFRVAVGGKERILYDAKNGSSLPGTVVRKEGEPPTADVAVNEAYDGSGYTYDLYNNVYQRNSIDGNGMRLDFNCSLSSGATTMHFGMVSKWSMVMAMKICLPSERIFNRFTIAVDVMGHELTHGVTQFEAKLTYSQQPGALNEFDV